MCVDIRCLIKKIHEVECKDSANCICKMVCDFFFALNKERPEEEIQEIFSNNTHLFSDEAVYAIIDPLRHAFDSFAYGGLHHLYTRQQNEAWYPKIKLIRVLEPNDISILNESIVVYRGCSVKEYVSKLYGQSWSTSKKVAADFAYNHYQNQSWFNLDDRVVLKSIIKKSNIFYSNQEGEYEVAVDANYLNEVHLVDGNNNIYKFSCAMKSS